MKYPIKKAVFPVAGMGTRFLPATKANPKEMLPIVDKPLIQYAVEEAVAAGITEMIFVTSYGKRAIEDHFDSNFELETKLSQRGKYDVLEIVKNILPKGISCSYVRQHEALGLGHAVLCARHIVGNEPFAVVLADDLIDGNSSTCLEQMVATFQTNPTSTIAVQQVTMSEVHKYGIVDIKDNTHKLSRIFNIVEKPNAEQAPSNLAAIGRYILTPEIFNCLEQIKPGSGGEIQLTDAIAMLLASKPVHAFQFDGTRYDCGSKLEYMQANIVYALKHPEIKVALREFLAQLQVEELAEITA
ncbi:MAG: gtaB [Gammaproteobacteria bacterium]|jgi:UTP--glucose-1-phosphate uridylyltransferase|nr:gtaB [Gammaproteobacteria bacterium]